MIGFFEFQYLSFKKKSLGNLIALAKADGHLDPAEEHLLYKLGAKYGLKDRQISVMINSDKSYKMFSPHSHDEKMNMFYDIMQLVYADGIVASQEIDFCHSIAEKFGYKPEIVPWLLQSFSTKETPDRQTWNEMIENARSSFTLEN